MRALLNTRAAALAACALALAQFGAAASAQKAAKPADTQRAISDELRRLYEDDQKDQNDPDWTAENDRAFTERQVARRDRAIEIVRAGWLATAADFDHAAMLLQHGQVAEDYLLAHVLAIPPAVEKHAKSGFMPAATLDRFLHRIGRPQIFSTQSGSADPKHPVPIEPFDDSMAETIRAAYGFQPRPSAADEKSARSKAPSSKELPKLLAAAERGAKAPDAGGDGAAPDWLVRVRAIVAAGAFKKGEDFALAARALLHSSSDADLLQAHVLATAAALAGDGDALPLCAETLDRFLSAAGQPQRFGSITGDGAPPIAEPALPEVVLARYGLAKPAPASK